MQKITDYLSLAVVKLARNLSSQSKNARKLNEYNGHWVFSFANRCCIDSPPANTRILWSTWSCFQSCSFTILSMIWFIWLYYIHVWICTSNYVFRLKVILYSSRQKKVPILISISFNCLVFRFCFMSNVNRLAMAKQFSVWLGVLQAICKIVA